MRYPFFWENYSLIVLSQFALAVIQKQCSKAGTKPAECENGSMHLFLGLERCHFHALAGVSYGSYQL